MAGPRTRAGVSSYLQMADDVAALLATLGLDRPVVGGYSDGGLVTLELGARHPGVAGALLVGAAYPHVDGALSELTRTFLGVGDTDAPGVAHVEANFGDQAGVVKSWHQGGKERWRAIVQQTASMWVDYEGSTAEESARSTSLSWSSPAAATRRWEGST